MKMKPVTVSLFEIHRYVYRPAMGVSFRKRNVTRSNAKEAAKQGGRRRLGEWAKALSPAYSAVPLRPPWIAPRAETSHSTPRFRKETPMAGRRAVL